MAVVDQKKKDAFAERFAQGLEQAESGDDNVDVDADVDNDADDAGDDVGADVNAGAGDDVDADVDAGTGDDVGADVDVDADVDAGTGDDVGADVDVDADADAGFDDGSDDYKKWSPEKLRRSYGAVKGTAAEAQRRLQALEKGQRQHQAPEPKAFKVPDELKDDLAELEKMNPDVAAIAFEDSPDGALVRKTLEEYGATTAAIGGRGIVAERLLYASQAQGHEVAKQAHLSAIFGAHPDMKDVVSDNPVVREEMYAKLEKWTAGLPFNEADKINKALGLHDKRWMGTGTAAEIIAAFDKFKGKGKSQKPPGPSRQTQEDAEALSGGKRKASAPPKSEPDKGDFSGGFKEQARRLKKKG